ncbi:MAG TPA: flagellar biosynthetic protein FliO [Waddliaceae bacterium]
MKRVFFYLLLSLSFLNSLSSAEATAIFSQNENTITNAPTDEVPYEETLKEGGEGDSRFFQEFLSMLSSLGIIIGVIFFLMWILRRVMNVRMEQVNLTNLVKVLERRPLSPKTTIYILSIYGKAVTIADSHNGVTLLSESPLPPTVAETS